MTTTYSPRRDSEAKTARLAVLAMRAVRAVPGCNRRTLVDLITNDDDYDKSVCGVVGAIGLGATNLTYALRLLETQGKVKSAVGGGPGAPMHYYPASPSELHRKEAERLAECAQQWGETAANNDQDQAMAQMARDCAQLALVHALLATLPDNEREVQ